MKAKLKAILKMLWIGPIMIVAFGVLTGVFLATLQPDVIKYN